MITDIPLIEDKVSSKELGSIVGAFKNNRRISAILLAFKGTETRRSASLTLMMEQLQYLLPESYEKNLLICFTYVSDPSKIEAVPMLRNADFDTGKSFKFDNGCFTHPDDMRLCFSETDQSELEDSLEWNGKIWKRNVRESMRLLEQIKGLEPLSSDVIKRLQDDKDNLKSFYDKS